MATHKNAITTWGEIQVITSPQAYNIAGNYTPVKYTFQLVRTATNFGGYWSNNASTAKLSINGTAITVPNFTYDFRTNYTKVLATGTINIPHNSDGTKTFAISASTTTDASLPNGSLSASETLATIPRASSIGTISGNQIGSPITVNISRASTSFTHRVYYHLPGQDWQEVATAATTSSTFTIPGSSISFIPNATSGQLRIMIRTYSGGTRIGGDITKYHTVYIPTSTFTAPTSFTVGSAFTVSVSRNATQLTHWVTLYDGSTLVYSSGNTVGTSVSPNIAASTLIARMSGVKSKAFTLRVDTYNGDTNVGRQTKTITANIPVSTFTAPTSFTMGDAFTVSVSRVGSLTHFVQLYDGGTMLYSSGNTVGTSDGVDVPLSALAARSPNAMSKVFTIKVSTYNGNTNVGSTSKNITGNVPSTVEPTFSAITVSENVSSVNTLVGAYVQGKSRLNLAITGASGIYGSTIKSYLITGGGNFNPISAQSGTTKIISKSGPLSVHARVTDSRGQYLLKSIVVDILPYTPPTISNLSFGRTLPDKTEAPLGDNVTVRASVKVHSLIVNGVQKNSIKYQVQSAQFGGSFADKVNTTSASLTKSYSDVWVGYSVDHSYNFRVRVGDVFGFGGWSVGIVPTGIVTQQWGSKTTSFGKMIDDTSYNIQVGTGGIQSDGPVRNTQIVEYTTNSDADNITTQWVLSGGANYPEVGYWYMNTLFYQTTSGNAKQIAYKYNTNEVAIRYRQGGVWSGWELQVKNLNDLESRIQNKLDNINNHYISQLTPRNGWTSNSGFGPLQSETRSGIVMVTGLVTGGEVDSVIAILPNSQRPTFTLRFVCGSASTSTLIDVKPNGEIVHKGGSTTNVSLNNISYIKR